MKLDNTLKNNGITSAECHEADVVETPTAGRPFEVNPLGIDRSKFKKTRSDREQERTRQKINQAFVEVDQNPEKYASEFYTLIPQEKKVGYITISALKEQAIELGGQMTDRIEQALEWAQRIDNGESWERVCNLPDTAEWHRGIIWNMRNGYVRIVGGAQMGSQKPRDSRSATWDSCRDLKPSCYINWTVPLVTIRKDGLAQTPTMLNITLGRGITTSYEVVRTPGEGMLFEVNPLKIDRCMFEKPRNDKEQERTRQRIQEAFDKVDKQPEKYASVFYTLIPEMKKDYSRTAKELEAYAERFGGLMANWIEQALEWAQRIFNGESWEEVCNNSDSADWFRIIHWKDGYYRMVGGSAYMWNSNPASKVCDKCLCDSDYLSNTVPLVAIRKK